METRLMPIVGAFTIPAPVLPGAGFDGVVQLNMVGVGSCSGTLLSTGRHILTAAHCLTDGNGQIDSNTTNAIFHLPGRTVSLPVPRANYSVHGGWNGSPGNGNDIAVLTLPELAPLGAERHSPFQGRDEEGRWFHIVGYGMSGRANPCQGNCNTLPGGTKRMGQNFIDDLEGPNNSIMKSDFDEDRANWPSGQLEVMASFGDSGGPSFLWGPTGLEVAGISSFVRDNNFLGGDPEFEFGELFFSTRVSSFSNPQRTGWLDQNLAGRYDLVLDMQNQVAGNNGGADTITAQLVGSNLELSINGSLVHRDALSNLRSLTLRGSNDRDVITVPASLGINITVDGRFGSDELTVTDQARTTAGVYDILVDRVIPTSPVPIVHSNVENLVLLTGSGNDSINVQHTTVPLTVRAGRGNDTFRVGDPTNRLRHTAAITLDGEGDTNSLTVNDQGTLSNETYTITETQFRRTAGVGNTTYANIGTLTVNAGAGNGTAGQTIDILSTAANLTRVFGSPRNDTINVQRLGWQRTTEVFAGAGNDTLNVGSANSLDWIHSPLLLDGQTGTDTLNINDQADGIANTYTVTHRAADTRVQRRGRFVSDNPADFRFQAVETCVLNASGFGDEITLEGLAQGPSVMTVNAGGGDDVLRVRETPAVTTTTLNGGTGNDSVTLGHGLNNLDSLRGRVNVNGEAGTDSMVLTDTVSALAHGYTFNGAEMSRSGGVAVNVGYSLLETVTLTAGTGNDSINLGDATNRLRHTHRLILDGGAGSNALNVNDQGTTSAETYTLTGTTFSRTAGVGVTEYSRFANLQINAGTNSDTIDVASAPAGVAVLIRGGTGTDTLAGPNAVNLWELTGAGAGTLNTGVTFLGVENLRGGTNTDRFRIRPGGAVPGTLLGGLGIDTLDYSQYPAAASMTLTATAPTVTGTATAVGNGFTSIESMVGGSSSDTLSGANVASNWTISSVNGGAVAGFTFTGVENLTGGTASDRFQFQNGASLAGSIAGGLGSDTLDYAGYGSEVMVALSGTATAVGVGFSGIEAVLGSSFSDTLMGANVATTWSITAPNAGSVNGSLTFTAVENLVGGSANDRFAIAEGQFLDGYLDGGEGINTLDYSAWTTGVYVDLYNYAAQGTWFVVNLQNVLGGAGDDYLHGDWQDNLLVGNNGHDILVGDEANDVLQGGAGHDQLYGGGGADRLEGGTGEDLLIDGWTSYDYDVNALSAIWSAWTDTNVSYQDRIGSLRGLLNADNVFSDGDVDELLGQDGLDWFWAFEGFDVLDRQDPAEVNS